MLFTIFLAPAFTILYLLNPFKNSRKECVHLKINGKKYKVEVANTAFKKSLGLMYRRVGSTPGMIFIYKKPAKPIFYNKNVKFPVRIYFLDNNKNIVDSFLMPADTFSFFKPRAKSTIVLEVPATSEDLGSLVKIEL